MRTFHAKNYTFYHKIENGDMNWIIPGRFLAFSTPRNQRVTDDVSTSKNSIF
jgi:cell division cycle 14